MKQVRIHGPNDARLDDVPEPDPGPRDVVVAVSACGVCGTDLKWIAMGGLPGPTGDPMPLGHELAGVVEAVGDEVTGLAVGDRVVVHPGDDQSGRIGNGAAEGGFAPHLLVREAASGGRIFHVPDNLPLDLAALTEPLGVAINAVNKAEVAEGDKVVVFGAGPIGLATIAVCVDRGAQDVIAVDVSPERLELATALGAGAALNATEGDVWDTIMGRHGSVPFMFGPTAGTDAFVEASGASSVIGQVLDHARPGARLSVAGVHMDPIATSFMNIMMKELTIRGAIEYPERFEDAIDLLERCDLSAMVTHRVSLGDWPDVMDLVLGPPSYGKVLVTMD